MQEPDLRILTDAELAWRFGRILKDAEHAWDRQDFETLDRVAKEVPDGYVLCIFNIQRASPCFSITSTEDLKRIPDGFRCIEAHERAIRSAQEPEPSNDSEPDGPSPEPGVSSSLERDLKDGRGIL